MTETASLRRLISRLKFRVDGVEVPRILLGTSPFVGAGQFGARSMQYYWRFYMNPENIVDLVCASAELGVVGIQLLSEDVLLRAVRRAEERLGFRFTVVATVGPGSPIDGVRKMLEFQTVAMLVHGGITDRRSKRVLSKILDEIRSHGCLAGIATHEPSRTLRWMMEADLDVDMVMLPMNKRGRFMDAPPEEIADLVKALGKPAIGKKVLAAGAIPPEEAIEYVASLGCIDAVALGVTSREEAVEAFTAAARILSEQEP